MGELLKNHFGPDVPVKIARMIAAVYPLFDSDAFVAHAIDGYEELELKERGRKIARSLYKFLPGDYEAAVGILVSSLGPKLGNPEGQGMAPFLYFPHIAFVHDYGVNHFEASMRAQYELTQRFTAEFSIRPFLEQYPKATLERLRKWASDPSLHVRRLVSEGTRPRLPWASRLRPFQEDPSSVLELLELLKDDPELYVRRSVANNLNDIGKDHPELLVETARRWLKNASEERRWLVKHALRSAVKRGNRGALAVLGYENDSGFVVSSVSISPQQAVMGGEVTVSFNLKNTNPKSRRVMLDFQIHFVKSNGSTRPKVFKLKELELEAGELIHVKKSVSLREMTTRKHYPGVHAIDALLNGSVCRLGQFELHPS